MNNNLKYHGNLTNGPDQVEVELRTVQFKQDGSYIIYAPAIEVYGYGKTVAEAKSSFSECLKAFVDYSMKKGTFEAELKRLGWKVNGSKRNRRFKTPGLVDLMTNHQRLNEIMNQQDVKISKKDLAIPAG